LHGSDLDVPAGQVVAFVGGRARQSSLVALLSPLLWQGDRRDGVDVGTSRESLGADGVVLQATFLFSGTIANIRHGRLDASDVGLEAARAVRAHPFIERLPRG
jgi:ABC-type multidrug transport system fused ATPase/permease subunit